MLPDQLIIRRKKNENIFQFPPFKKYLIKKWKKIKIKNIKYIFESDSEELDSKYEVSGIS